MEDSQKTLRAILGIAAGIMGGAIGYVLAGGEPLIAFLIAVVGIIIMFIVRHVLVSHARKHGEILYDEMHLTVATRAGYSALRISLIAVAFTIIITVWPRFFNISIIPAEIADRLYPGLCLSLAIMSLAYIAMYNYYMKSKKVIEG